MDQSFRQQHKQSTAAAAQKISRFPSPVLMDDVSGSGKKRHKYHEGTGRSAVPRLLWWGAEKKGRYSGRESVTRNFPVCVLIVCREKEKRPALPKEQTAFAYTCGAGNGITDSAPAFPASVSSRSRRSVIYRGTAPGPFPRSGGRRSRNRPCIPHNGYPRHPEPQGPDGCRACRGQRRRNRPACP